MALAGAMNTHYYVGHSRVCWYAVKCIIKEADALASDLSVDYQMAVLFLWHTYCFYWSSVVTLVSSQ